MSTATGSGLHESRLHPNTMKILRTRGNGLESTLHFMMEIEIALKSLSAMHGRLDLLRGQDSEGNGDGHGSSHVCTVHKIFSSVSRITLISPKIKILAETLHLIGRVDA